MSSCVKSLESITSHELVLAEERFLRNDSSDPAQRIYTVCPNTVLRVGVQVQGLDYMDGTVPLVVLNPNLVIRCGNDGSVKNNCVMKGGDIQVLAPLAADVPNTNPSADNLLIEGFIFEGASLMAILFRAPGRRIQIVDCAFVHTTGTNFVSYFESDTPAIAANARKSSRELQQQNEQIGPTIAVSFQGCTFKVRYSRENWCCTG